MDICFTDMCVLAQKSHCPNEKNIFLGSIVCSAVCCYSVMKSFWKKRLTFESCLFFLIYVKTDSMKFLLSQILTELISIIVGGSGKPGIFYCFTLNILLGKSNYIAAFLAASPAVAFVSPRPAPTCPILPWSGRCRRRPILNQNWYMGRLNFPV